MLRHLLSLFIIYNAQQKRDKTFMGCLEGRAVVTKCHQGCRVAGERPGGWRDGRKRRRRREREKEKEKTESPIVTGEKLGELGSS